MKLSASCFVQGIIPAVTRTNPRSKEELFNNIDKFSKKWSVVKKYSPEIKLLPEKHIETIVDAIEISKNSGLITNSLNFSKKNKQGVKYRELLIKELIEASKDNPAAVDLVNTIFRNTDRKTSKYVLAFMTTGLLTAAKLSEHMKELTKVIPDVVQRSLKRKWRLPIEKRDDFMMWLVLTLNKRTKPDKIVPMFKELSTFCDSRKENLVIRVNKFLRSDASKEKMADNYKTLPSVLDLYGKNSKKFDIVDFVTQNTNLY